MVTSKQNFPRMHVSLYVSDLASTINFYTAFFGKPADKIRKGYAKYLLDTPSLIISFLENPERVSANFGHLGIQVETRAIMDRYLSVAREKGLVSKEEIGTACCYALQDKFWAEDPDGIQWEIYYFHEDAEFNDPHYAEEGSSACCLPSTEGAVSEKVEVPKNDKIKVTISEIKNVCDPQSGCC